MNTHTGKERKESMQFDAGIMEYKDGVVTPHPRQGRVSLSLLNTGCILLLWTSHSAVRVINFPDKKVSLNIVEKCVTGRVLCFEVEGRPPSFFWMQDKFQAKDDAFFMELKEWVESVSHSSLEALAGNPIQPDAFRKILATVASGQTSNVDLTNVMKSSKLAAALQADKEFFATRLGPHLPALDPPITDINGLLKVPQVMSAVKALNDALNHPQAYLSMCNSFSVPVTDPNGGVLAFLRGILMAAKSLPPNSGQ